jgi:hypothetical protein
MSDVDHLIGVLSNLSVFIPIAFYFLKIKSLPKPSHIIGMLVITSMIFDAVGFIRYSNKQSTVLLFNVYYVIQHVLLTVYFYKILFNRSKRVLFIAGIAVVIAGYLLISFTVQGVTVYQSYAWTVSSFILAAYGITYTSHQLRNPSLSDRNFQSTLFINGAVVIYFTFSFLMFVVDQYLLSANPEIVGATWSFHNVNNIVKNIALATGFYYTGKSNIGMTEHGVEALKEKRSDVRKD